MLYVLIQNAGRVVNKKTFMDLVWPDVDVEEGAIQQQISLLRKILGSDGSGGARLIETVPKRGYRFVGGVTERAPVEVAAPLFVRETHTRKRITINEKKSDVADEESVAAQPSLKSSAAAPAEALALPSAGVRMRSGARGTVFILTSFAIVVIALGAAIGWSRWGRAKGPRAATAATLTVRRLAVLPFNDLAGGVGDDYLRLGLADALITRLSGVRHLTVRPTSAILKYGERPVEAAAAGRELQVDAVLAGGFQRVGESVRVTVQLVDVRDGRTLWAQTFDDELTNIFAVQDSISAKVTDEIAPQLSSEEKVMLARHHTPSLEADRLYWKGRVLMKQSVRTPESVEKAIGFFKEAVAADPQFALAYADLAGAYEGASVLNLKEPREMFPLAIEAVHTALELDDTLSEAHAVAGSIKWEYDYDWDGGERELRRAIDLNPSNAAAHAAYADLLSKLGRHDEALVELGRAREIDPLSSNLQAVESFLLFNARRYEEAARQAEATIELDPYSYLAYMYGAAAYELQGRME
jgi:TolB-like protein/DNA-binding winged helix-turn-helix (wHTH) protein/Tfp pilus assembly protein PilF